MTARLARCAVATLCATALSSCGGEEPASKPVKLTGRPDPAAARVAQQYVDGYFDQNAKHVCSALASKVRKQLDEHGGCLKAVEDSFPVVFRENLKVARSYVKQGVASVTFRGSPRVVTLRQENGHWKVVDGGT